MLAWWLTFASNTGAMPGCVEAETRDEAIKIGCQVRGAEAVACDRLPYPADPRLNPVDRGQYGGVWPSFCYTPEQCKGRTACPKRKACDD